MRLKGVCPALLAVMIVAGLSGSDQAQTTRYRMSTELWLNSLGINLNSSKVTGHNFTINLVTPDNGEKFVI